MDPAVVFHSIVPCVALLYCRNFLSSSDQVSDTSKVSHTFIAIVENL